MFAYNPIRDSQVFPKLYTDVERIVITRARLISSNLVLSEFGEQWVQLYVNPSRLSISSSKVISRVQTNTRWVFQHWGLEPWIIQYNGVTGYMNASTREMTGTPDQGNDGPSSQSQVNRERAAVLGDMPSSPYDTEAYKALARLRNFYLEPHASLQGQDLTRVRGSDVDQRLKEMLLNFYYRNQIYTGYFTRMNIEEHEGSPWMWNYDMEFTAFKAKLDKGSYRPTTAADAVQSTKAFNDSYTVDKALTWAWNNIIQTTGTTQERELDLKENE